MEPGDTTGRSLRAVLARGAVVSGTYRVVRKIAAGGMGVVYEAEHLRLSGHRVALKVLMPEVSGDQEALARFRREAEICTRLKHANIVRVTDFNTIEDGTPYLVMEYLEGESLAIRMARGPISPEEALSILRQIGAALWAAHRQGIVHRDLKPGNVFLTRSDPAAEIAVVKVLDFGISKVLTAGTFYSGPESGVLGSPSYMSPEQAEGRNRDVGPASDQFSLAAIAVELLTGEKAFPGDSPSSILYRVVHREPDGLEAFEREYPAGMGAALRRALDKEPRRRHPSVAAFVEELGRECQPANGDGQDVQKRGRPGKVLRDILAILMLAALLSAGAYLLLSDWPIRQPRPAASAETGAERGAPGR